MRRYVLGGLALLMPLSLAAEVTSCNEAPADTNYGNPNTLARANLPGEGGTEPLICTGDAGARKYEGGTCPSFENDIFPYLQPKGTWRCSDTTCHGGVQAPKIDGTSAATCYASLQAVTVADKPYIPNAEAGTATTDPGATTMLCNLQGGCGTRMPESPGLDPTNDDLCMIQAWLACGAPGPPDGAAPAKGK